MGLDRYFVITSLPALGKLGSSPPIGLAELVDLVGAQGPRAKLVGTVVLLDDLLQREAFLAGELREVEPAILSVPQVRNEVPLPEYLRAPEFGASETQVRVIEADALWESYFRYAARVAEELQSPFLHGWVRFEVGLRNALASTRAKRLGLEELGYLVATDLADPSDDFSEIIGEWAAAPNPLNGLRAVIRGRWDWLEAHDRWFSFAEDELAAYTVRLMLLQQWLRTAPQEERPQEVSRT